MTDSPLLQVEQLSVQFAHAPYPAVRGVSFQLRRGETLALVGESGSGKSVSALSIAQLLPATARYLPGASVRWQGQELLGASAAQLRQLRGNRIGMIFQEPMNSLNPLHTLERQVGEVLTLHRGLRGAARRARVLELLQLVGLSEAESRLSAYPHQLSGGQRQRVMIAMALANEPDLLIADEPTTALDVTIQAQVLALLKDLQARFGMAVLFISHDLSVVQRLAERVAVMQGGEIVEHGQLQQVFQCPQHPYTQQLLAAAQLTAPSACPEDAPLLLEGRGIQVRFPLVSDWLGRPKRYLDAVAGVDVALREGETLGIVGESGSGKTTLGLALLRLQSSVGQIVYAGQRLDTLQGRALRPLRQQLQIVFQDPYAALSPRLSVAQIVAEGLQAHCLLPDPQQREARVAEVLREVGLDASCMQRYPHEFSGGQRQRIAIARALILQPKLLLLDEPTSALDVSVQAQIVALLRQLQQRYGLSYLFISHDLRVIAAMAHRIMVMQAGRVVEQGEARQILTQPQQRYTQELLQAAGLAAVGE